jgi:hypothetical protein
MINIETQRTILKSSAIGACAFFMSSIVFQASPSAAAPSLSWINESIVCSAMGPSDADYKSIAIKTDGTGQVVSGKLVSTDGTVDEFTVGTESRNESRSLKVTSKTNAPSVELEVIVMTYAPKGSNNVLAGSSTSVKINFATATAEAATYGWVLDMGRATGSTSYNCVPQ